MVTAIDTRAAESVAARRADRGSRAQGGALPQGQMDVTELLRILRPRMGLLAGTVLVVTSLAVVIAFQLTPRYSATAAVMVDTRRTNVADVEAVLSGLPLDVGTVQSEVRILTSRALAGKVVDKLGLQAQPELNSALQPPTLIGSALGFVKGLLGGSVGVTAESSEEEASLARAAVVDAFLSNLNVSPDGRSYVILISYESESPRLAARIVNTVAELYIVDQLEAKFEATRQATEWLNSRLEELRAEVQVSERAVAQYRAEHGLVATRDTTIVGQQLGELNSQLIVARTERARAEANLRQVRSLIASGGVETAADVLSSPLIGSLRQQEAEVQRRAAELATRYGERHPRMVNVLAEMRDIQAKIAGEVQKITQSLQSEVEIARTKERSLQSSLDELEGQQNDIGRAEVRLRELEREAAANRTLFESFLGRFKQNTDQEAIQQPDSRIISRADVPQVASYPKKRFIVGAAFAGSLVLGILLILLVERLDSGFRTSHQIEQLARLPTLGMVPMLTRKARNAGPVEEYVVDNPTSSFTESIRNLRSGLMLSDVDNPPKVVLVTSSVPGEGKTLLSVAMARDAARSGLRTILIECDFRRPRMRHVFRIDKDVGLLNILEGEDLGDTPPEIFRDERTGLYVVPALRKVPSPPDLLGSQHMRTFIEQLRRRFDLIILDTPPVLAVSDARVLSQAADKTIYVIRWEKTPRELAISGIRQLQDDGVDLAGAVLTQVNLRRHVRYGYGDHGYYYGRYKEYYG